MTLEQISKVTKDRVLVFVDAGSRLSEVEILRATSLEVVARRQQRIFSTHRLPEQAKYRRTAYLQHSDIPPHNSCTYAFPLFWRKIRDAI